MIEDYGDNPNSSPSEPFRVFFGRLISHGQRHLIRHYSVKNRLFIGNTSMDAQLSLIMANQAKVSEVLRDCLESEQIDAVKKHNSTTGSFVSLLIPEATPKQH